MSAENSPVKEIKEDAKMKEEISFKKTLGKRNRDMVEKEIIFQEKMCVIIVAFHDHIESISLGISQILQEYSITERDLPKGFNDEWINDFVARAFRDASSRLSAGFSKWSVQ